MKLGLAFAATVLATTALAQPAPAPPPRQSLQPPAAQTLAPAQELSRRMAAEATQGAAADGAYYYAIANFRIAKYEKATGRRVGEWLGQRYLTPHINACSVLGKELVCANSNYPGVPQTSSVEFFDPVAMKHLRTVSLGPGIGSLTWVDRKDGFWWAAFANYDVDGRESDHDHRWTTFVKFDEQWRRLEAWLFPPSVLERFAPTSSSGGGWGDDGLLYVTGHDRPELYALKLPAAGGVLEHVATVPVQVEGQGIAWDHSDKRTLWGITRTGREVISMRIPPVPKP